MGYLNNVDFNLLLTTFNFMFQIKRFAINASCVFIVFLVLFLLTAQRVSAQHATKRKVKTINVSKVASTKTTAVSKPTFLSVKPLLVKNTCISCHSETKRQVGPAFVAVAKRKYSVSEIVRLIHNPQPEHWPEYSTPMPPMTQVPKAEAEKIANWIRSLEKESDN
jgi:cytochrome c551/c552